MRPDNPTRFKGVAVSKNIDCFGNRPGIRASDRIFVVYEGSTPEAVAAKAKSAKAELRGRISCAWCPIFRSGDAGAFDPDQDGSATLALLHDAQILIKVWGERDGHTPPSAWSEPTQFPQRRGPRRRCCRGRAVRSG
jgi:hypothetical protein